MNLEDAQEYPKSQFEDFIENLQNIKIPEILQNYANNQIKICLSRFVIFLEKIF